MNDYELDKLRETFSRLFVLAVRNKINFTSFTNLLCQSEFLSKIERNKIDDIINIPVEKILFSITGFEVKVDNSYGVYNDAYWSGQNYFDLHLRTNKSFITENIMSSTKEYKDYILEKLRNVNNILNITMK